MKKWFQVFTIALFSLAILTGCGNNSVAKEDIKSQLEGQWVCAQEGESVIFRSDGTGVVDGMNMTWYIDGNELVIESLWYGTQFFEFSLSGNTLAIGGDIYKRQ